MPELSPTVRRLPLLVFGALAITAGILLLTRPGQPTASPPRDPTASRPATTAPSQEASGRPDPEGGRAGADSSSSAQPVQPSSGLPEGVAAGSAANPSPQYGHELPPAPTSAPSGLPGLTPTGPGAPLVTAVPSPVTALDRLVPGFPEVLAPPTGSVVESSGVTSDATRAQVSLVAATERSATEVLRHYRGVLGDEGFAEIPAASAAESTAAAFERGGETVVVTVSDGTLSLLATLVPGPPGPPGGP